MKIKVLIICLFVVSVFYYIASIIRFCDNDTSQGILMLSMGSSMMCIGCSLLSKSKRGKK